MIIPDYQMLEKVEIIANRLSDDPVGNIGPKILPFFLCIIICMKVNIPLTNKRNEDMLELLVNKNENFDLLIKIGNIYI